MAQSQDTDTATRLTAIQVCAERGLKEVVPVAETLARTPDCLPLRLSAIAAVDRSSGVQPTLGQQDHKPATGSASSFALGQLKPKTGQF